MLNRVRLLATPWTAAYQAPPSMGFARQEYWSGMPLPSPSEMLTSLKKEIHESAKTIDAQDLRVSKTSLSLVNGIKRLADCCSQNQASASIQVTGRQVRKLHDPVFIYSSNLTELC